MSNVRRLRYQQNSHSKVSLSFQEALDLMIHSDNLKIINKVNLYYKVHYLHIFFAIHWGELIE